MNKFIGIVLVILLIVGGVYLYNQNKAVVVPGGDENIDETPVSIEAVLTYAGTLPCASCPGIETTFTLADRGDGQGGGFSMTEVYLEEEDGTFESTGQWVLETKEVAEGVEAEVYVLTSEEMDNFQTREYEIVDEDTIRLLDQEGKRIDSELPYELKLQS